MNILSKTVYLSNDNFMPKNQFTYLDFQQSVIAVQAKKNISEIEIIVGRRRVLCYDVPVW